MEDFIALMWSEDWDPTRGNINLFVRDFGSVLTDLIHSALGGKIIVRSDVDLPHLLVFWPAARLEAFPFHKVYKRLSTRTGDSLLFFFDSLAQELEKRG